MTASTGKAPWVTETDMEDWRFWAGLYNKALMREDDLLVALGAIADGGWPGFDDEDPKGPAGLARAAIAGAIGERRPA